MGNKNNDISNSIEREQVLRTKLNEKGLDLLDKTSKKISDIKEILDDDKEAKNEIDGYVSRLKTNDNLQSENVQDEENISESKIKTNVNNSKTDTLSNKKTEINKTSRLKTNISNKLEFNDNQGKISKTITVSSKVGKKIEKAKRGIARLSSDLEKSSKGDGTGNQYLKTAVKREEKKVAKKISTKINKPIKTGIKKATSPITNKLKTALKEVAIKFIKKLLIFICSYAEIIIPVLFAFILIFASCSIFSTSKESKNSYQSYISTIQAEYDNQVDDFLKQNPDYISVGVRGSYGKVDWRSVFSIIQGLGEDSNYDQSEKDLLKHLKDAGLFEKHYIIDQTVTTGTGEFKQEKTIKVMVIVNPVLEDYIDWINNNFSYAKDYMTKKKTLLLGQTSLNDYQKDLINMLYTSDDLLSEFDIQYQDNGVKFGTNLVKRNLDSDNYNSKNALATSGYKGQCTWYSYGRALESTNKKTPTGNAQTWITRAITLGLPTGNQPRANSIVVMAGSKFGHVAYVESYDGSKIMISEGNVGNACYGKDDCDQVEYANNHANELVRDKTYNSFSEFKKSRMASGYYIIGFIYLD